MTSGPERGYIKTEVNFGQSGAASDSDTLTESAPSAAFEDVTGEMRAVFDSYTPQMREKIDRLCNQQGIIPEAFNFVEKDDVPELRRIFDRIKVTNDVDALSQLAKEIKGITG